MIPSPGADGVRRHNAAITVFVIAWIVFFQYQTLRLNYLNPLATQLWHRDLPKIPLLFPPAGWIMFYNVDPAYGLAEVYGLRRGVPEAIDPHAIFPMKNLGYDNIRRNVLVSVLSADSAPRFCRYLARKFPGYASFAVVYAGYPDLVNTPDRLTRHLAYRCPPSGDKLQVTSDRKE
jgi:hypothetical protein